MYNQTAINILNFTISSEHCFIISLSHFPPTHTLSHTPKQSQLWFFFCCCSTIDWMYLRNSYKRNHGIFHMRFLLLSIIFLRFTQVLHSSFLYIAEKYFCRNIPQFTPVCRAVSISIPDNSLFSYFVYHE